jgi:hypothetical protein
MTNTYGPFTYTKRSWTKSGRLWEKKQKNCDPENPLDDDYGDQWDHVALDAGSRLVVSMVPGKRTGENTLELIQDFKKRTGEKPPALVTSDEYGPYATVLGSQYSDVVALPHTGKPGRPPKPRLVPCPDLVYATVRKTREKGRVVNVTKTLVYGTQEQLDTALAMSTVSRTINTSFVERYNATDRTFSARKTRKTYCFSKDRRMHEAASWIGITAYNFCRPHRGLTIKHGDGAKELRTPAMAAGLSTKPLSLETIMQTQMFPKPVSLAV